MRCRPFLAVIALMSFAFFSARPAGAQSASALDGRPSSGTGTAAAPVDSPLPSAEEIVARYEAATGAREVKAAFTTRFVKGLYQSEDSSGFAGIEQFSKSPNKRYSKISFTNGITVREVCDGKSAWIEDPIGGVHGYTGAALESRLRAASFGNGEGLLNLNMAGRVTGVTQVGAHATYEVHFSPEKKYSLIVYFDTTSGLIARADDVFQRDDGPYTVQTFFDDYRPIDGLNVPFKFRHVEKGSIYTIRVTQIKNNPAVDDSLFVKPYTRAAAQQ